MYRVKTEGGIKQCVTSDCDHLEANRKCNEAKEEDLCSERVLVGRQICFQRLEEIISIGWGKCNIIGFPVT